MYLFGGRGGGGIGFFSRDTFGCGDSRICVWFSCAFDSVEGGEKWGKLNVLMLFLSGDFDFLAYGYFEIWQCGFWG